MNIDKTWRKSSYSGAGNNCVELVVGRAATSVRDSKKPELRLTFGDRPFRAFLTSVRHA
ncbi:DUF397 domain-containing protein [Saccharothrix syringae]|uniref:DUF397 domain-containing protein n=1 Tax=Saccharothrix syringae TaxID=103733 RepID=A0A5Q0GU99_SACSY|nr:DUF397 domain-containing protein [Saccharothrix syringae]QFZ17529.1 DUF397 domain-containing protein [Saccharothrix syringae]